MSENVKKAYMSYIVNGVHSCYNKAVAYEILNCQPGDIMEYISDQPRSQEGAWSYAILHPPTLYN